MQKPSVTPFRILGVVHVIVGLLLRPLIMIFKATMGVRPSV